MALLIISVMEIILSCLPATTKQQSSTQLICSNSSIFFVPPSSTKRFVDSLRSFNLRKRGGKKILAVLIDSFLSLMYLLVESQQHVLSAHVSKSVVARQLWMLTWKGKKKKGGSNILDNIQDTNLIWEVIKRKSTAAGMLCFFSFLCPAKIPKQNTIKTTKNLNT